MSAKILHLPSAPFHPITATMSSSLPPYKSHLLTTCLNASTLKFGNFTLKSGRQSPYFFNTALFHRADLSRALSSAYAQTLVSSDPDFDVLFGPAYKGIPLASTTVERLAELAPDRFGAVSFAFNRKEAKYVELFFFFITTEQAKTFPSQRTVVNQVNRQHMTIRALSRHIAEMLRERFNSLLWAEWFA